MSKELNCGSFFKNIGWATSASFVNHLINVLFLFYSSQLLAPTEYGLMSMILAFTGFSEIIVNASFVPALIY